MQRGWDSGDQISRASAARTESGHDDRSDVCLCTEKLFSLHALLLGRGAKVHSKINRNIVTISETQTVEEGQGMSKEYKKVIVSSLRLHSFE